VRASTRRSKSASPSSSARTTKKRLRVGDRRRSAHAGQIKAALRDGGVRGRIHRELVHRVETIESELQSGEEGRQRLLQDPELPAGLKLQLADIPVRALREPS
jgi:hypothetical protein